MEPLGVTELGLVARKLLLVKASAVPSVFFRTRRIPDGMRRVSVATINTKARNPASAQANILI